MYTWNWHVVLDNKQVFVEGALVTIGLTLLVVVIGTLLGTILALMRRSKDSVLSFLARIFIELFRALPILVLLIWIFYVGPIIFNIRFSPFAAGVLALSLNLAAFVAETVRAAIESIPRHQYESGLVLGLTPWQTMRRVILPQATRNMVPNLLGLYITQLKNSSLVSVIAVNELLHQANLLISNTYRPLEIYTAVAIGYLILIIPLILVANHFEKKLQRRVRTA